MHKTVLIDCFENNLPRLLEGRAIVAVDVVRATTTAITGATLGRTCFVVPTLAMALELAKKVRDPLLAGELKGVVPPHFHIDNSPAELAKRVDVARPLILLSSSGTRLCHEAAKFKAAFAACLRNYPAVAKYIERFDQVALIGAASRGEFREEDQICCAWIAERLLDSGYSPANAMTSDLVKRWRNRPVTSWLAGESAAYLRSSGRIADLDFILDHVGDVSSTFVFRGAELVCASSTFGKSLDASASAMRVWT
jgi:2-phosphosulfolactate phosphatase